MRAISSVGQSLLHAVRRYPTGPSPSGTNGYARWVVQERLASAAIRGAAKAVRIHDRNLGRLLDVLA